MGSRIITSDEAKERLFKVSISEHNSVSKSKK